MDTTFLVSYRVAHGSCPGARSLCSLTTRLIEDSIQFPVIISYDSNCHNNLKSHPRFHIMKVHELLSLQKDTFEENLGILGNTFYTDLYISQISSLKDELMDDINSFIKEAIVCIGTHSIF
jgi:hypothetical protein